MERPSKRPRLPSVPPVSSTNKTHFREQQRSDNKLQSAWESIISKYSDIPEDAGDEIDMDTNSIVVDRGHVAGLGEGGGRIRGGARHVLRQIIDDVEDDEDGEEEEEEEGTPERDELAPSMSPQPQKKKPAKEVGQEDTDVGTQRNPTVPITPSNEAPKLRSGPTNTTTDSTAQTPQLNPAQVALQAAQIAQPMMTQQPDIAAFAALGQAIWGQFSSFMANYAPSAAPTTSAIPSLTLSSPAPNSSSLSTAKRKQPSTGDMWSTVKRPRIFPRLQTMAPSIGSRDQSERLAGDHGMLSEDAQDLDDDIRGSISEPLRRYPTATDSRRYVTEPLAFSKEEIAYMLEQREVLGTSWRKMYDDWEKGWNGKTMRQVQAYYYNHYRRKSKPDDVWGAAEESYLAATYPRIPPSTIEESQPPVTTESASSPRQPQQLLTPSTSNSAANQSESRTLDAKEPVVPDTEDEADDAEDMEDNAMLFEEEADAHLQTNVEEPETNRIPARPCLGSSIPPDAIIESVESDEPSNSEATEVSTPKRASLLSAKPRKITNFPNLPLRPSPKAQITPKKPTQSRPNQYIIPDDEDDDDDEIHLVDPITIKEESETPELPQISSLMATPQHQQASTTSKLPSSAAKSAKSIDKSAKSTPREPQITDSARMRAEYRRAEKMKWYLEAKTSRKGTPVPSRRSSGVGVAKVVRKRLPEEDTSEDELAG